MEFHLIYIPLWPLLLSVGAGKGICCIRYFIKVTQILNYKYSRQNKKTIRVGNYSHKETTRVALIMCNAWKTPEENQVLHCIPDDREIEVDLALRGRIPSGEMDMTWKDIHLEAVDGREVWMEYKCANNWKD